jgi:hypothetical protein
VPRTRDVDQKRLPLVIVHQRGTHRLDVPHSCQSFGGVRSVLRQRSLCGMRDQTGLGLARLKDLQALNIGCSFMIEGGQQRSRFR